MDKLTKLFDINVINIAVLSAGCFIFGIEPIIISFIMFTAMKSQYNVQSKCSIKQN